MNLIYSKRDNDLSEEWTHTHKIKNFQSQMPWGRPASFSQPGPIIDPHIPPKTLTWALRSHRTRKYLGFSICTGEDLGIRILLISLTGTRDPDKEVYRVIVHYFLLFTHKKDNRKRVTVTLFNFFPPIEGCKLCIMSGLHGVNWSSVLHRIVL